MDYNKSMAVQMAIARTSAAELQVLVEHPSEPAIREYAIDVFGDADRAEEWIQSEIPSLGGKSPASLLGTAEDESLRRVIKTLIQIDYGVCA